MTTLNDCKTGDQVVAHLLREGLITRDKSGAIRLRSQGRRMLAVLQVIDSLGSRAEQVLGEQQ